MTANVPDRSAQRVPFGRDARAAAVRGIASIMLEHLHGLSVRSASEIWNREAELRSAMNGPDQLYASCRTTMGAALSSLVSGQLGDDHVREVRTVGRVASEQGMPLEVVLRGLRVDFLVLWSEMLLVARTTDPTTQQSLINASEIVWAAVDAVTAQFTIGYRSNHEARLRAEAAQREDLLLRILKGDAAPRAVVHDVLAVDAGEEYVVVVVDASRGSEVDGLTRCVRYASMHSVWATRGSDVVGLVALRGLQMQEAVAALGRGAGLRAGMSRPRRTLAEAPGALEEASLALASKTSGSDGVATIFDDPLAVLVAAQPALVDDLVRGVLGALLDRGCRDRRVLIETVLAFDACDGSVPDVAEATFCHRNTVLNRLAKISRLTGISFSSPSGLALVGLVARALRAGIPAGMEDE